MRSCGNLQLRPTPRIYIRPKYSDPFFNTPAELRAALTSGAYEMVVVDVALSGPDSAAVTAGLASGDYLPVIFDGGSYGPDSGSVSAALESGAYALVIVDGAIGPDTGSVSAALAAGAYELVVVDTAAPPLESTNLFATLLSGSYVLA